MAKHALPSIEHVRSILDYDPETGVFVWRDRTDIPHNINCRFRGKRAGRLNGLGYREITINFHMMREHRLAWFYVTGAWPEAEIDHINGDKADNRITNLRPASRGQNSQNRVRHKTTKTGVRHVYFEPNCVNKYRVRLRANGRKISIGTYATLAEAKVAAKDAALRLHKEFAAVNR